MASKFVRGIIEIDDTEKFPQKLDDTGSDEGGHEITLTPRNYENAHLNMEKVLQIPYSGKRLHPTVCMNINISEHR